MMSVNDHVFVAWEEHIMCHERGRRVVHYYLKEESGDLILAVIGTERSIRHMMYVVSGEFVQAYGSKASINACTKWRARREVVEWLTTLVSKQWQDEISNPPRNEPGQTPPITDTHQAYIRDQMVPRKFKVQYSQIKWFGDAWICGKQLKHYPAFCRDEITITVHSFVFIMALEDYHYLAYLEDMYEDKKGQKKVKVRWFHHNQEAKSLIPQLNPHPREVFITPHVQVISAECIDGPATVLTPKHYEKCMASVPPDSSPAVYMCFRQFKNHKLKPFSLAKLQGYSNQAILSSLDGHFTSKQNILCHKLYGEDEDELTRSDPVWVKSKKKRSHKDYQGVEAGHSGTRNSACENQLIKYKQIYPKLKLRLSRKTMDTKLVGTDLLCPISLKVDERIEILCQDSGLRGCWFRCKVLQVSQKRLKVQYADVEDVEGSGYLEEWIPVFRVASPDKLGMRCSGRLTIWPHPPEDSTDFTFEVGSAVDAWWSDGWWESVVTGVGTSKANTLQVYFQGEGRFLTLLKENIRASKDWFGNKWIDIKAKPDILLYISENDSSGMKLSNCYSTAGSCGFKVPWTPKLKAIEEGGQGLADLVAAVELLENMDISSSSSQPHTIGNAVTNHSSCTDDDDAKEVIPEGFYPVDEKCELSEVMVSHPSAEVVSVVF